MSPHTFAQSYVQTLPSQRAGRLQTHTPSPGAGVPSPCTPPVGVGAAASQRPLTHTAARRAQGCPARPGPCALHPELPSASRAGHTWHPMARVIVGPEAVVRMEHLLSVQPGVDYCSGTVLPTALADCFVSKVSC